jgi:hypothetical protein
MPSELRASIGLKQWSPVTNLSGKMKLVDQRIEYSRNCRFFPLHKAALKT